MQQSEKQAAHFIYAGLSNTGEQYQYYILNNLIDNDGKFSAISYLEPFSTAKKIFKLGSIGAIYPVELVNDGNTVQYKSSSQYIDYWKTDNDLITWRINDSAGRAILQMKKQGKENQLSKILEPIKRTYKLARTSDSRAAILAEVIRIITS